MSLSVVIYNYNGFELLSKKLLNFVSILKKEFGAKVEIILIDDYSNDSSVDFVKSNFKSEIKLIKHTKKRGYPVAVNTGVRVSKSNMILFPNLDFSIKNSFFDKNLDKFVDNKTFSLTSSNNIIFDKKIWQELGGLDEKLFSTQFWSKFDICYRAAKHGYSNLPQLDVNPIMNNILDKNMLKQFKIEQLLLIWKNIHSKKILTKHIYGLIRKVIRKPKNFIYIIEAVTKLKTVIKLRKKEIKESCVSDEFVVSLLIGDGKIKI